MTMNGAVSSWGEDRPLQSQLVEAAISKLRRGAQVAHVKSATRGKLSLLFLVATLAALAALSVVFVW
jgi:hypothetical protein